MKVKLSQIIAAAVLTLATAVNAQSLKAVPAGDVNGDGQITVADAVLILRAAVGTIAFPADKARNADVDGDGQITVRDALATLLVVVQLAPPTSTEQPQPLPEKSPQLLVTTDKFGYKPAEPVTINITLKNPSSTAVKWTFPSSQIYEITISGQGGRKVWTWSEGRMFLTVITELTLAPGEERHWSETWDQKTADGAQVPDGYYKITAELVPMKNGENGPQVSGSTTIGIGEGYQEPPANYPLPIPGEERVFVSTDGRWPQKTIKGLGYATVDGNTYTRISLTPESGNEALLRLTDDFTVLQRADGRDALRYQLNAAVGETWIFDFGTKAKATMASRSDVLDTPLGRFERCLRIEYFVGPDFAWTEWLAPNVGLVGWDFYGIAGPVSYRILSHKKPLANHQTGQIN